MRTDSPPPRLILRIVEFQASDGPCPRAAYIPAGKADKLHSYSVRWSVLLVGECSWRIWGDSISNRRLKERFPDKVDPSLRTTGQADWDKDPSRATDSSFLNFVWYVLHLFPHSIFCFPSLAYFSTIKTIESWQKFFYFIHAWGFLSMVGTHSLLLSFVPWMTNYLRWMLGSFLGAGPEWRRQIKPVCRPLQARCLMLDSKLSITSFCLWGVRAG